MLTRPMSVGAAHAQKRRPRLRKRRAVIAWAVRHRNRSALMVARMDAMRADHLRRYRARPGPWL